MKRYKVKSHRLDDGREALTVIVIDENGEEDDLNASGYPCFTTMELAEFIEDLHSYGAYGPEVKEDLMRQIS